MNRWEVQFDKATIPVTVEAPTAVDAITIAASVIRRASGRIVGPEYMRVPWGIRWLFTASGMPATEAVARAEATPWKCNICGEMHGPSTVDAHRHEDDPRSAYYVAPKVESP